MKKLIVIGIIAMMITGLSVAANAMAGTVLNLQPQNDNGSVQTVLVGWMTDPLTSNLGTDDLDYDNTLGAGQPDQILTRVQNALIGSRVKQDYRAPILGESDFQIWEIRTQVGNNPSHTAATFGLKAWFGDYPATNSAFWILNGNFTTQQACLDAIAGGSSVIAKLDGTNQSYDSGASTWNINAPVYNEDLEAWTTPYTRFTVYAGYQAPLTTPEPGSMLAMFSGLVGLVGFGIRRRK